MNDEKEDDLSDALTKEEIDDLANRWYKALDVHAPVAELHAMMTDEGNDMEWPELPTHGHAEFTVWYEKVTRRFFDEVHTVKSVESTIDGDTGRREGRRQLGGPRLGAAGAEEHLSPHGRVPDLGGRARPRERQGADQQVLRRLLRAECPTRTAASAPTRATC